MSSELKPKDDQISLIEALREIAASCMKNDQEDKLPALSCILTEAADEIERLITTKHPAVEALKLVKPFMDEHDGYHEKGTQMQNAIDAMNAALTSQTPAETSDPTRRGRR